MPFVSEHVNPYPDYDVRKFGTITVINMSHVRGTSAWNTWDKLSSTQQHALVREIQGYVEQLCTLAPPSVS